MKKTNSKQEKIIQQVQKLLEERGRKALEMAKKEMLQEKIECKEVREALKYFMTEYWHDLARPALLSLCCEAVGGDPELTIPIAIPLSLISGGIDIHDDIIDQSKIKRSRPTVLGKFGKDIALLVGDALLFKGLSLLCEKNKKGIYDEKMQVILGILKTMFFELGDAEALELNFRRRIDITPEEYLDVVRKKAADVEAHTRISAILGGGSKDEIEALGNYGRLLGMILILRDDLWDMTDLRETLHRIEKECLPLPILYALQDPDTKPEIASLLLKKTITKKDVKTILKITERVNGLIQSQKTLQELSKKASLFIENLKSRKYLKAFVQAAPYPFIARTRLV